MEESPKLTVRLELDSDGKPVFSDDGKHRHYRVVFEVENAPDDAYAATFDLDPSYFDPKPTVTPDSEGKLRLRTTTYGDYAVSVRLHRQSGQSVVMKGIVSRALRDSLGGTAPPSPLAAALEDIAAH